MRLVATERGLHFRDSGIIRPRHSTSWGGLRTVGDTNVRPSVLRPRTVRTPPKGRGMEFVSAMMIGYGVAGVLYVAYLFWTTQEK
jgi:hypothetical protein